MKRYILHTPFNIYHFETDKWPHPVHNHTYFEIIFIIRGQGKHNLNGNTFDYTSGDVYLLGPDDFHNFDVEALTEFCFIRFNESFNQSHLDETGKRWKQIMKTLLLTSSKGRGSVVRHKQEKQKLFNLLAVLEEEYENSKSTYFEMMRDSLMESMMTILIRNLSGLDATKPLSPFKDTIENILLFIKQNIFNPSKLTIDSLAEEFNLSPAYISIFFKNHIGESLKQYITKYKIKLIEVRLLYSEIPLSEIAHEFSFTDESHMCKQFKKYTGSTPKKFRNRGLGSYADGQ